MVGRKTSRSTDDGRSVTSCGKASSNILTKRDLESEQQAQELALAQLASYKDRLLDLWKRAYLSDPDLERQLAQLAGDEAAITTRLQAGKQALGAQVPVTATIAKARAFLEGWAARVDAQAMLGLRRDVVEGLIMGIHVGSLQAINVTYVFSEHSAGICSMRRPSPLISLKHTLRYVQTVQGSGIR